MSFDWRKPWQLLPLLGKVAFPWVERIRHVGEAVWSQPRARYRLLIVVAAVLVSVYAFSVLAYVIATPEIGVRCVFTRTVNHFYDEFLDPPDQDAIREGDVIVAIAGHPVRDWSQFLRKLTHLLKEPADAGDQDLLRKAAQDNDTDLSHLLIDGQHVVRVLYQRPGDPDNQVRSVWLKLGPTPPFTLVPSVLWLLLKLGLFVVGAIVFWKRPGDSAAAHFFVLCIVSVGAFIGGYHFAHIVTQPILLIVFMTCGLLLPPVTLHFYLVFPRPKRILERHPRWVLTLLYGPALVFLLLMLNAYLRLHWLYPNGASDSPYEEAVARTLRELLWETYVYFVFAALWYIASVVSLLHSFFTAADDSEKNQVKWILFGAAAALVPIGYTLYLARFYPEKFGGGAGTWPMFTASLCLTAAFTISITRYRLLQLDQLLSSGVVYFLLSFLAGLVYYGIAFVGLVLVNSRGGEWPSVMQALLVSATALVLLVALDLMRARLKSVLDHHFRREKYQLDRTWRRMSEAIEQLVDSPTLARRLLQTAAELLGTGRGSVYLREGDSPLYGLTHAIGVAPALTELSVGCPLVEAVGEHGAATARRLLIANPARRQLLFLGGETAHGLFHEGELLGLLVLGPKESGTYTPDDLNLLTAFAQITALALVSTKGHRTIDELNRELQGKVEKIAEQHRRILVLQSQLANRKALVQASPASDKEAPVAVDGLVGSSPQVRQLLYLVRKVAPTPSAVLLRGESGTGKGLLARAIHDNSPRAAKAFVKVHCSDLAPSLLESELFGHVKGAFTNAIRDKEGRFEAAHGGTVFLDEIGDVAPEVQIKLLRVLQEMTFERVGSNQPVQVDVRVVAATHQDLETLIRQGRFREDLYYRLNVLPLAVPPLRERAEDVPELALHFLRVYGQRAGKPGLQIDDDALILLKSYAWPGNVRQLENAIEHAVAFVDGPMVTIQDLPSDVATSVEGMDAAVEKVSRPVGGFAVAYEGRSPTSPFQVEQIERERRERELLVRTLAAAAGNKAEAARALGMARSTLLSRLKRLGLG
jgi:transcriptional regulator with GAF, ATPase, and Fis domain